MPAPSPSKKSVSNIKSKLLQPSLSSYFQCWFNPPGNDTEKVKKFLIERSQAGVGVPYNGEFPEKLSLLCSEASLPGSSLATHEINNDFTGVTERHAYRRLYDDRADFTFYVDHDHNVIKFFENWISYVVNEQYTDQNRNPNKGIEQPQYSYRVNYPDDYRTEVYITKFEKDYKNYTEYRLLQAYPISINSIPLSYDSPSLLKCTVSFTYTRYVLMGKEDKNLSGDITSNFNLTPQQFGAINASYFNPNLISGLEYSKFTTTGGISYSSASAAGNSIDIQKAYSR